MCIANGSDRKRATHRSRSSRFANIFHPDMEPTFETPPNSTKTSDMVFKILSVVVSPANCFANSEYRMEMIVVSSGHGRSLIASSIFSCFCYKLFTLLSERSFAARSMNFFARDKKTRYTLKNKKTFIIFFQQRVSPTRRTEYRRLSSRRGTGVCSSPQAWFRFVMRSYQTMFKKRSLGKLVHF